MHSFLKPLTDATVLVFLVFDVLLLRLVSTLRVLAQPIQSLKKALHA